MLEQSLHIVLDDNWIEHIPICAYDLRLRLRQRERASFPARAVT